MKEVIDPRTLLYGPRRWQKRNIVRPGWRYPSLVGSSNLNVSLIAAEAGNGEIAAAFVEPVQILVEGVNACRLLPYAWLEPRGRFREHRYVQDRKGVHYFSWMTSKDSCWVGHATPKGAQEKNPALVTHSTEPVELVPADDGCWAIWSEYNTSDGVTRLQGQLLRGGGGGISRRILDFSPGKASRIAVGGDGSETWVGWSVFDKGWTVRLAHLGGEREAIEIPAPGKVHELKVAVREGVPCATWTDPDSEDFYFADNDGIHPIGSGYPDWAVLDSGEVVFAWSDWMSNDGLLFASLRGSGSRLEIDSIQGALPMRHEPESIVVGSGADGSAKICWASRSERRPQLTEVFCQSVRDGIPEMPETIPGNWNGGSVSLKKPFRTPGKMILPISHSTAAAIYLWRADLRS